MSYFAKIIQIIVIVVIIFTDWITNIYGEDNGRCRGPEYSVRFSGWGFICNFGGELFLKHY